MLSEVWGEKEDVSNLVIGSLKRKREKKVSLRVKKRGRKTSERGEDSILQRREDF